MAYDPKSHWQSVYITKSDQELSWTQANVHTSLSLIAKAAPAHGRVIDVGGGSSVLAGRLLDLGYAVTVLDVSAAALARAAGKLGAQAARICWIDADVTDAPADLGQFDLWHDRAVFQFLTEPSDRAAYRALLERTIPAGGHAIIATFAPDGPAKCSGLDVRRYDSTLLAAQIGSGFELRQSVAETHLTPWSKPQSFQYSLFRRV